MSEDDLMADVQIQLTDFSELISIYTQGFEGRGWLVKQVSDLLDEPGCRFVILTDGAGMGQSAFQPGTCCWPHVVFVSGVHKD